MDNIEIKGIQRSLVTIEISPKELCDKLVGHLLTKYKLHGNWVKDGNLMREDSDYHSEWDVVDRPATEKDLEVLNAIETLQKLVKEEV